jgi:hypothetical protein
MQSQFTPTAPGYPRLGVPTAPAHPFGGPLNIGRNVGAVEIFGGRTFGELNGRVSDAHGDTPHTAPLVTQMTVRLHAGCDAAEQTKFLYRGEILIVFKEDRKKAPALGHRPRKWMWEDASQPPRTVCTPRLWTKKCPAHFVENIDRIFVLAGDCQTSSIKNGYAALAVANTTELKLDSYFVDKMGLQGAARRTYLRPGDDICVVPSADTGVRFSHKGTLIGKSKDSIDIIRDSYMDIWI